MRIAFIGWNHFQYTQIEDLAESIPNSVFILEIKKSNTDLFSQDFIDNSKIPIIECNSNEIHKLKPCFDIFVVQTVFPQLFRLAPKKIAMIQYGYAKEPHNYGAWRSLADLIMVYGSYAQERCSYFAPTESIGNPRFDRWHTPEFHEEAKKKYTKDPNKSTILYLPTWGKLSSIDKFITPISKLASCYNVLIKPHHNTLSIESQRKSNMTNSGIDFYGEKDDTLSLIAASDIVISDYSGAIFDAIFFEKPLILLDADQKTLNRERKIDPYSAELSMRSKLGTAVKSTSDLYKAIPDILKNNKTNTDKALKNVFFDETKNSRQKAINALLNLHNNKYKKNQQQIYLHDFAIDHYKAAYNQLPKRIEKYVKLLLSILKINKTTKINRNNLIKKAMHFKAIKNEKKHFAYTEITSLLYNNTTKNQPKEK